jgi:hypothetical protein
MKDHPLQPADNVSGLLQLVLGLAIEVDRILAGRHLRQQVPVRGWDLHHVVDPGIVANVHLRQPEISTLAGVPRDNVVDHGPTMCGRHLTQSAKFHVGPKRPVDLHAYPVEMTIHTRGHLLADNAAGSLHRAGVHSVDADGLERGPQIVVCQGTQERMARLCDHRDGIRGEPDRGPPDRRRGIGDGEWVLPHISNA